MKTIDTKEILISEYFTTRLAERERWKELIHRLEIYLEDNFDNQLSLILASMQIREEDLTSNCFDKCCDMAVPLFERFERMLECDILELSILCSTINYNKNYKRSLLLAEKGFEISYALEQKGNPDAWKARAMISINLTMRLVRARFVDIDPAKQGADLAEIKKEFKRHLKLGRDVLTEPKHKVMKLVLNIREALFNRNCDDICDGLFKLKKAKEVVWLKALEDEVMDYLFHFRMLLSTEQINLLVGLRIRRRRQELSLSLDDFSEEMAMERTSIIKVENGTVGLHTPKLFLAADLLGVGITYFYGDPQKKLYETEEDRFAHKISLAMRNSTDNEKELLHSIAMTLADHKKPPSKRKKRDF